jgi:tetratricopeptide (TPR) repeat protein
VFGACMALLGAMAGGIALAGVLHASGLRTPRLERFHLNWTISGSGLVQRAYDRLWAGETAEALELFHLALRRDPASPYRWCDYAEALLLTGDRARARDCMVRGIELGPYIGPILMRGVNFAYRTGDRAGALGYGNRLLALTGDYDVAIFTVWERMEAPASSVLERGIPDGRAAQAYHRRLMGRGSAGDAKACWDWILQHGFADDRLADDHAGFLLRSRESSEALRAWTAWAGEREPGYPVANAIFNGDFERAPAGAVFDWRIEAVDGARAERDSTVSATGSWSLRLSFDQKHNLHYRHVSQRVVVRPGAWRFEGRMRTEGITTNEGIGFRIFDIEAPQRLDVRTGRLNGTHEWTTLGARFVVSAATRVIGVQAVRSPSPKFDNKLGGTAWIDALSLRRESR